VFISFRKIFIFYVTLIIVFGFDKIFLIDP